jgi:hypothetical protein
MSIGKIRKGALHKRLHVAPGKKIPLSKLRAAKARAKRTGDKRLMKQATFALNFRGHK